MMTRRQRLIATIFALMLATAGCAAGTSPPPLAQSDDSPLPGTIRVLVQGGPTGVRVTALGKASPAAAAGLRVGDIVLRYNGTPVANGLQFYRLMTDSRPGSSARLEVLRDGLLHEIDVPVEQVDTAPRA
jgi:S1-C subfamily serine protease